MKLNQINLKQFMSLTIIGTTLAFTTSCAKDLGGSTYVDSANAGVVLEGTVVSARPVKIKSSDKLGGAGSNGLGMLGGGAMGGIAGNSLGKGTGNAAATVGGAILGAVIGNVIEDQLGQSEGVEYIVKVSDDNMSTGDSSDENVSISTGNSIKNKITNNTKIKAKTKMVSVVQGKDQIFSPGQKVYVIYSDDRPRLAPAI
jgi:outer membrane lipoprotein SlyB